MKRTGPGTSALIAITLVCRGGAVRAQPLPLCETTDDKRATPVPLLLACYPAWLFTIRNEHSKHSSISGWCCGCIMVPIVRTGDLPGRGGVNQGQLDLPADLVSACLATPGQITVGTLALRDLYQIVHCDPQYLSIGEAQFDFDIEGFLTNGGDVVAVGALIYLNPIVGRIGHIGVHPRDREIDLRLFGRDMPDQENRDLVFRVNLFESKVEIDRVLAEQHLGPIRPGIRPANLHVGMIACAS